MVKENAHSGAEQIESKQDPSALGVPTPSLQPMFVTNRTSLPEIDQHLANASTRIVVVTVERDKQHGLEVIQHVGAHYEDVRMVLVCDGSIQEVLAMSFRPGVWACVGRQSSVETLRTAIDSVAAGKRFIAEDLTHSSPVVNSPMTSGGSNSLNSVNVESTAPKHTPQLTRRERQVLSLIAQGRPRREIAELLSVSPRTIDAYRARLLQKLGLDSSVQLVKYAIAEGLAE